MKVGDVIDANIVVTRVVKHVKAVECEVPGTCVGCVFYQDTNGCQCAAANSYQLVCTFNTGKSIIFKEA